MGFFNKWNRPKEQNFPTFEETNNPNMAENTAPLPVQLDNCLYFIGKTLQGRTALRIQSEDGYTSMTLSMTDSAVRQMINLLEAAISEEEEVNNDAE